LKARVIHGQLVALAAVSWSRPLSDSKERRAVSWSHKPIESNPIILYW